MSMDMVRRVCGCGCGDCVSAASFLSFTRFVWREEFFLETNGRISNSPAEKCSK